MRKMPTLVKPVRAPSRIVEPVRPSTRVVEIPHADLWIGDGNGYLTLVDPNFGDDAGFHVVRAWIGISGRGQQWWPAEGAITGAQKVLMAEGFDGGGGYASYNQHYWVGDWPTGSYPTPWPSLAGSWGTRRTWPVPTGGTASRVSCCGVDWNPFTEVLCCIMGEYNASWPGNGYHFTAFRSTDYGDTWTEIQDVTGSEPLVGYQANGSWYRDYFYPDTLTFSQAQPRGDGLRFLGGTMWMYAFQDNGVYIFSEDDGLTWHSPAAVMNDATAHRLVEYGAPPLVPDDVQRYYELNWMTYDGLFQGDMGTNWKFNSVDGPFRSLCGIPATGSRTVYGTGAPKVCPTESLGANQWHIASEAFTQDTSQGVYWTAGILPYVSDGNQFQMYGRKGVPPVSSFRFVPGAAGNRWLYSGGETSYTTGRIAIVPTENFSPSTLLKSISSVSFVVSSAFQANVYLGWAYSGSPSPKSMDAGQIAVTPHPTTSGAWRAWFIDGLIPFYGAYSYTICYSDDQGTSWTTKADYSNGGAIFRSQWLAKGMHPFFFPGQAPGQCWVTDIVFHPSDPQTLLSIGKAGTTIGFCQAASYDGGNTWDDLVEFNDPTSGGPTSVARLVPMYAAPDAMAIPDLSREAFNDNTAVIVHAPEVLLAGQRVVASGPTVIHAPAADASVRNMVSAPVVIVAPGVETAPAYVLLGTASALLHAPSVGTGNTQVIPAPLVVMAPACVAYQEAKISTYRIVDASPLILHAPPWATQVSVGSASAVAHAPKVLIQGGGLVQVTTPSTVVHAPGVVSSGTAPDSSIAGEAIAGSNIA